MDKEKVGGDKGLKVVLSVLIIAAIGLGVSIFVVGASVDNNNDSRDENIVTEYTTVNEDGEEVRVQVRSYKPEKTESKSTGSGSGNKNESDVIHVSELNSDDSSESKTNESELEKE